MLKLKKIMKHIKIILIKIIILIVEKCKDCLLCYTLVVPLLKRLNKKVQVFIYLY